MKSPEEIAAVFKEKQIKVDYSFFFSYIQPAPKEGGGIWSAAEELVKVNGMYNLIFLNNRSKLMHQTVQLLHNFLEGLALAQALPKTVLLQLGAKYYGLHLGPISLPPEESDPRVHLEPNFYYNQEDLLKDFASKHGISWATTRPSWIPGAVPDAAMNLCLPLAIYASVQKHLGNALEYPADLTAWESNQTLSSAQMNAYTAEWAVLSGNVNQSFNAHDDCVFTWGKSWPKLAARFDMPWKGPDTNDNAEFRQLTTPFTPPPRGFGPPATMRYKFTLAEWAKRPDVQEAWKQIAAKHQLREPALRDIDRIFGFADAALLCSYSANFRYVCKSFLVDGTSANPVYSSTKAKKLGFFGFVDSVESMFEVFREFSDMKMIPPLP